MTECLVATISRELLTLPPLSIGADGDPIQFDGSNQGTRAIVWSGDDWQRQMADSPWVHGELMVAARKKNSGMDWNMWIESSSFTGIQNNFNALLAAVTQWTYTVTVYTGDTVTYAFRAWTADINMGWTRTHLFMLAAPVTVSFPVMPLGLT
jgi:hypothetical protein